MFLKKLKGAILFVGLIGSFGLHGQTEIMVVEPVDMEDNAFVSSCQAFAESRLVIRNVTEDNYIDLESCIRNYFATLPNALKEEVLPVDEVVSIALRMMTELLGTGTDPNCYTAELDRIEYTFTGSQSNTLVEFIWNGAPANAIEFSGVFIDLRNDSEAFFDIGQTTNNVQSYSLLVPGRLSHKCYAINGSCTGEAQSAFHFIIIIETDVRSEGPGEDPPSGNEAPTTGPVGGGGSAASPTNLVQLLPNPVKDQAAHLLLELEQAQVASISITNQLGQVIYSVAQAETFAAGAHRVDLPTQNLEPGIYFVLVEQVQKRRVVKLIVL